MKEGWMKNDEEWMKNDDDGWRMNDEGMNDECRVAFATENVNIHILVPF